MISSVILASSCASIDGATTGTTVSGPATIALRWIGTHRLEHGLQFGGTTVGGLSGIDYDAARDIYYVISDDKSEFAPTRFYTARIALDAEGLHDVALQSVVTLLTPEGRPYPPRARGGSADAEAIRHDAFTDTVWWTSEGERRLSHAGVARRLGDPFVRQAARDGRHLGEVPLDPMFHVVAEPRGPRDNLSFEGASLSTDGSALWVAMEGPLLQDDAEPTMQRGAWTRITRHPRDASERFGAMDAQYVYRLDAIPKTHAWTSRRAANGVSEILAIDATRMLVLERAFVFGPHWHVRLYEADTASATDVRSIASLATQPGFTPMSKRLVLDFDTLGVAIDNLEGLCFGPTLPNGHRTLVLVADDNFNPGEATQFVAFEIVPLR